MPPLIRDDEVVKKSLNRATKVWTSCILALRFLEILPDQIFYEISNSKFLETSEFIQHYIIYVDFSLFWS